MSAERQAVSPLECIRGEYGKLLDYGMFNSRSSRMFVCGGGGKKVVRCASVYPYSFPYTVSYITYIKKKREKQ